MNLNGIARRAASGIGSDHRVAIQDLRRALQPSADILGRLEMVGIHDETQHGQQHESRHSRPVAPDRTPQESRQQRVKRGHGRHQRQIDGRVAIEPEHVHEGDDVTAARRIIKRGDTGPIGIHDDADETQHRGRTNQKDPFRKSAPAHQWQLFPADAARRIPAVLEQNRAGDEFRDRHQDNRDIPHPDQLATDAQGHGRVEGPGKVRP